MERRTGEESSHEYTLDGSLDLHGRPAQRSATGRWKACYFLIGYEVFERMAFHAISANLVIYMTKELHEGTVSSARNVNNWIGAVWLTPLLGAYVADTYLGRFWTFLLASLIYLLGMGLLTLSASVRALKPPPCGVGGECKKASGLQIGIFFVSLYVLAIGTGGTKPNISAFGADQFDEMWAEERAEKNSFFNWWMFSVFFGALVAQSAMVYIQENVGWGLGYGIPTSGLFVSIIIFVSGSCFYRFRVVSRGESPLYRVIRSLVTAIRKWKAEVPADPSKLFELDETEPYQKLLQKIPHTNSLRFLDKAAVRTEDPELPLCTVTQVEETKQVIRMLPVWLATLIPSTVLAQVNTFFVKQGTTMNRHILGNSFEIPAASLGIFITLSMLIFVALYERFIVPFARRHTQNPRGISLLQRMGIGFAIQILVMVVAFVIEMRRLSKAEPMSIWWLLPQNVLMGIADGFVNVAELEFFYDQSPQDLKSFGTALSATSLGLGNFLSSLLVTSVEKFTGKFKQGGWLTNNLNKSHLDYYYALIAILCFLNILLFFIVAKQYVYKPELRSPSYPNFEMVLGFSKGDSVVQTVSHTEEHADV